MDDLARKLADGKVGLVAMAHMSNVLGTVTPAERIVALAHAHGAKVLLDGSQAAVHRRVDVQAIGCDFYSSPATSCTARPASACSGRGSSCSTRMPPFLGGGDMIAP
jgi:cysteine desulfurase / selenocysteine lyase